MSGTDDDMDNGETLHVAVAHALGFDDDVIDLVEERPPIDSIDIDDGTNEAIRLRMLLSNHPFVP